MTKNNFFSSFLIAIFFSTFSLAQEVQNLGSDKIDPSRFFSVAVVQGLNKTTARTSILEMKIGDKINFGSLRIIARKCWQAPLEQKPESKILIEVFETKNEDGEEKETRIFYGWMFASSPSISGIEHPIYDLTAISCRNK